MKRIGINLAGRTAIGKSAEGYYRHQLYIYSSDGTRIGKTVNGQSMSYLWDGGKLLSQTSGSDTQVFLYHGDSRVAVEFMGQLYYYVYNLQGDVVELVDKIGTTMVTYKYDAWGKPESTTGPMATTLGVANPFRYRGYYYDTESGYYYLQSRYYDPEAGRFLNADGYVSTGQGIPGHNMFAYCNNNPVNYKDSEGTLPVLAVLGVIAITGLCLSLSGDNPSYEREQAEIQYNYELENARQEYNENTVSINNNLNPEDTKVHVTIAPEYIKDGKKDPVINIKDSHKIKSKAEKKAILEVVISSPEFDPTVFKRGMDSWLAEWEGHNALY